MCGTDGPVSVSDPPCMRAGLAGRMAFKWSVIMKIKKGPERGSLKQDNLITGGGDRKGRKIAFCSSVNIRFFGTELRNSVCKSC